MERPFGTLDYIHPYQSNLPRRGDSKISNIVFDVDSGADLNSPIWNSRVAAEPIEEVQE